MDGLGFLFGVITFLLIFFTIITVVGHLIWISVAWIFYKLSGKGKEPPASKESVWERCVNCGELVRDSYEKCFRCGTPKPSDQTKELKKELEAAWRQIHNLHRKGSIDSQTFNAIKDALETERDRILGKPKPQPAPKTEPEPFVTQTPIETWKETQPTRVTVEQTPTFKQEEAKDIIESVEPIVVQETFKSTNVWPSSETWKEEKKESQPAPPPPPPIPQQPSRSWTEVVEAFMEQSNIRWGEIVGGLLIIGCSTALVISLWNQISQIPVLKFLIFTSVTAAIFGIGLYTEHRWKLPTTSRGILTIATLLVPLNFLAIAAVSSVEISSYIVLVCEALAPVLFFIFVYFAGKTLTPNFPQVLAIGVLGSSIGQILIHHFSTAEMAQGRVLSLGFVTTICFVASLVWMMLKTKSNDEITEETANSIFITLGTSTFAAILPLSLLLYKSADVGNTLMWISPLIGLCAAPLLASGVFLWKGIEDKKLAYSRLAGTTIAIIGGLIVFASMLIAYPNPASIVLTALINFLVFTAIAFLFNLPVAHAIALFAFTLAFTVGVQVITGSVPWQMPRTEPLLPILFSPRTGQLFAPLFLLYFFASEFLRSKTRDKDSGSYFVASLAVTAISMALLAYFGFAVSGDVYFLTPIFTIFAAGIFAYAWTRKLNALAWVASFILILSLTQGYGYLYRAFFAWQTALLIYSTLATIAAIIFWQRGEDAKRIYANPLRWAALIASGFVVIALIQSRPWQSTAMITAKLYWLSLIWFGLLWLISSRWLFAATQSALMSACLLTTKLILQNFDWYDFRPLVYLHPTALHIYGSMILILTIAWTILRLTIKRFAFAGSAEHENKNNLLQSLHSFLNKQEVTFDRLAALFVFITFIFLTIYSAMHGVVYELSLRDEILKLSDIAGYSHAFSYGFSAWVVFALLLLTAFILMKEKARFFYLYVAIITLSLACPLIASNWETPIAVASAWRWFAALFLILSFVAMQRGETILQTLGLTTEDTANLWLAEKLSSFLSITPILIFTLIPLLFVSIDFAIQGTASGFFNSIGVVFSYTLPLALVTIILSLKYMFAGNPRSALRAGLMATLAVVTAHLFSVYSTNGAMDRTVATQVFQLIAISCSAFSILWLATRKLFDVNENGSRYYLGSLISLGAASNLFLITPVALRLFAQPEWIGIGTLETGSFRGWLALIFCLIAVGWFLKSFEIKVRVIILYAALFCISAMKAFTLARWDNHTNWRGFHILFLGMIATAWLMWLTNFIPKRFTPPGENETKTFPAFEDNWNFKSAFFSSLAILFVLLMALRSTVAPTTHWWSVAPLILVCVLSACLFTSTLNRLFMYASGGLLCLAFTLWYLFSFECTTIVLVCYGETSTLVSIININLLAISIVGIASYILEKYFRASIPDKSFRAIVPSFNIFGFITLLTILTFIFISGIGTDLSSETSATPNSYLFGGMILAFGILAFTFLWDGESKNSRLIIYLYCLLAPLLILDRSNLEPKQIVWISIIILGIYALITSLIWWQRERLIDIASQLKIVIEVRESLYWLRFYNFSLALLASILATGVVIYFEELHFRLVVSIVIVSQLLSIGLLAQGEQKQIWQRAALIIFSVGLSLFGCAFLQPGITGTWMNRSVVLMIVMFVLLTSFGALKSKLKDGFDDWVESAKTIAPLWIVVSGLSLLFVLATEVSQQIQYGEVKTQTLALIVVAITLLSGAIACVVFAAEADKDPLALSDKRRMVYVYVAEGLIALLFMHIRLSMPWLFSGFFEKYWPIVVVVLCYIGIGLSEILRRRNLITLSKPIENTGVFLPLLPVLGFWMVNSRVNYDVDYTIVLFAIGILYGALSLMRRSFGFGILAALAANGGLWYALHRTDGFGLPQHPQLWFIPLALSVLVAAYLNRELFDERQMTGIRYVSLMMVYVSSTADIFINGVATSPWLPLILMLLSVAGVLFGIMFRIRAFLFLGALFLLISMVTMIYYASSNLGWTWLWWVAGIFVGGAIIFTFALFEKKKQEMMQVLEEMRAWEK